MDTRHEPDLFRNLKEQLDTGKVIGEFHVAAVLQKLLELLYREENIVSVRAPVVICGDVHGQYEDVLELFQTVEFDGNRSMQFIFMGDYVDRGRFSLNTFLLLAGYKLLNPAKIILLRGNHESRSVTQTYGFYTEIQANYGHTGLWTLCMEVFDMLPMAAISDTNAFSVHGGLSPEWKEQLLIA
jgi:diadenosine tetraphosphatase ApaH/serine/threonine PP2A family protein phosphatase